MQSVFAQCRLFLKVVPEVKKNLRISEKANKIIKSYAPWDHFQLYDRGSEVNSLQMQGYETLLQWLLWKKVYYSLAT